MRTFRSDLKIGFVALITTITVGFVMIYLAYEKYTLSRNFLDDAQRMSATLPVLAVTEGQVAQWTDELRKKERFKGELDAHLVEQINEIRLGKYKTEELNAHLTSCLRFCNQLVNKILLANMSEVAMLPHELVFFDHDRDQVTPHYQKALKQFARRNNNKTVYLMSRASFAGSQSFNKELSERRLKQVEKILRSCGLSDDQIKVSWPGYQAPQLTMEIATSYRVNPEEYKGDLFRLNQSVVLFTNPPSQYSPGILNTLQNALAEKMGATTQDKPQSEKPQTVSQLPQSNQKKL